MALSSDEFDLEVQHDVLIPMRDDVALAANLYRPAVAGRVPCIVNYIPYHKDGRGGLGYTDRVHRYFVEHDYAVLVVDFRGLGGSEGINITPFDSQEGRDGHDIVEWAAGQSWCNGNVGMWGVSYGGITALKTASEQPPHLKAIVPIHATADNLRDFLHLGGCPGGFWSNGDWGPRMIGYNLTPPLRAERDGREAQLWRQRLEYCVPWPLEWYWNPEQSHRWDERAIPIERITAATYAVCGWQDFYAQGTVDYFRRLQGPRKLLMGPWKHVFPNLATIEPINFLDVIVRWWDRWLRGDMNGVDDGPAVTLFVQGSGVWRQEEAWPPSRNEEQSLWLRPQGELGHEAPPPSAEPLARYRYDPTVGLDSIGSDPWTTAIPDRGDHTTDDGRSLCFTTAPLEEDWELTGEARVLLNLRASVPGLNLVAKLCDVPPAGRSRLVTMGWVPDSRAVAETVHPCEIKLRATAHVFRRGHRIRLALALADFPRLWPTPQPGEIELFQSPEHPSRLVVPRTPAQQPPLPTPEFPSPGPALKAPAELESSQSWRVVRELVQQTAILECHTLSKYQLDPAGTVSYTHEYTASVPENNPAHAAIRSSSEIVVQRPQGEVRIKTVNTFTPTSAVVAAEIRQQGEVTFRKRWETT